MTDQMTTGNEKRGKVVDKREAKNGRWKESAKRKGRQRMTEKRISTGKAESRVRSEPRLDYTTYRFSKKEIAQYVAMYLILDTAISYLFFYSPIAFFVLLPGLWPFLKEQKASLKRKRESEMRRQFLDGIQMTSASLQAGYSVENAFREAAGELTRIYKEGDFILREFRILSTQMDMSRNIEDLLMDLGRRSGVEDIISFAEVFLTAKRSGGDLLLIIRNTASCIRQKHETLQEIETCLSGKVMEQNIMSLVPVLILAYVKVSSPEFLDGMYGNLTGMAVMTVCFVVYVIAYLWGKRIVQIEV